MLCPLQEAEEQRKHNQLEVQRGKLAAEEERVQKQLRALQEQMATRKEIVQKELAAAKAKKQLELEVRGQVTGLCDNDYLAVPTMALKVHGPGSGGGCAMASSPTLHLGHAHAV
jgi:hypothetical protein